MDYFASCWPSFAKVSAGRLSFAEATKGKRMARKGGRVMVGSEGKQADVEGFKIPEQVGNDTVGRDDTAD